MLSIACCKSILSSSFLRLSILIFLVASLLSAQAHAQVVYTGTPANENLGTVAIGSSGTAQSLNFKISAGTTIGSIGVLTQGAPNLDFTSASGTTCAAQNYPSATTCVVNVTFTPGYAGLRKGAVVFFAASGNCGTVLESLPVYGIGAGPQIAFNPEPSRAVPLTSDYSYLWAIALDGAGSLFLTDEGGDHVIEVATPGLVSARL
jgi:hypothetical protein